MRISEEYNIALLAEPSEYGSGRKVIICNRKSPEDTNGPVIVSADSIRISQVISNLLRNAIKFSGPESNITINLGRDTTNKAVLITISDSGPGIHPAVLPKLFEKFVSKSEKGTGLGLFISKGIIEAHGGKIWAKNNDTGKGATFAFAIPARG